MNGPARAAKPQEIRIAGFLERSTVNGPGVRSVIWVQGCPLRCEGCFNPALQDPGGGTVTDTGRLFKAIESVDGTDGVTFSGGEPFAQAKALAELAGRVHNRGMTVVTFSGYRYEDLKTGDCLQWQRLLEETDLLVSGPFIRGIPAIHPLTGSGNQEVRYLSGRIPVSTGSMANPAGTVEFTISRTGSVTMTGFPKEGQLGFFSMTNAPGGF
jgi:anaerobic ribonucleoside-triphosphate reductase activating protein